MFLDDRSLLICVLGCLFTCNKYLFGIGIVCFLYAIHMIERPMQTIDISNILHHKKIIESQPTSDYPLIIGVLFGFLLLINQFYMPKQPQVWMKSLQYIGWMGVLLTACFPSHDLSLFEIDEKFYWLLAASLTDDPLLRSVLICVGVSLINN